MDLYGKKRGNLAFSILQMLFLNIRPKIAGKIRTTFPNPRDDEGGGGRGCSA